MTTLFSQTSTHPADHLPGCVGVLGPLALLPEALAINKETIEKLYLSWVNDFLTTESFAAYYGLTYSVARAVIQDGRELHEYKLKKAAFAASGKGELA